ncbi:hypothetical protein OAL15_02715 [Flavobacteriales bacterium]|nr:hypothetical protein [Flavobacteriales bacterium]
MNYEQLPDIPKEFCNSETGKPFTNCLVCECNLQEEAQPYSIERAIRHYPEMKINSVVFEYALCASCTSTMENELSSKTKLSIMQFFAKNFNYSKRPSWTSVDVETKEPLDFNSEEWINNCAINGSSKSELFEYTLCARCIGKKIIPEVAPYMISGTAQDELIELFSNKSLGFLDDFTDKHFSGPPELKELFKGRPILV